MSDEAYKYLSRMPHFSFLPQNERRRLADSTSEKVYPKDTLYASQGETAIDAIFIVRKGSLSLFDERSGEPILTGYIKAGEVFGGITILMNAGISLRTVVVDKNCSGYAISKEIFQDICTRYKPFFEYFLDNFSNHIFDESLSSIIETGQAAYFLSEVVPFSFIPQEEIEKAAGELSVVQYPEDTVISVQGGTRLGYVYVLQKGSAEHYFEENSQKTMIEMLGEGSIYGGISVLLNDGISVRTVRTIERCYFYLVPKQVFLELCTRHEAFSEYFTDIFGRRMLEKSYASIIAKTSHAREEGSLFFNQSVSGIVTKRPVFGHTTMSIQAAAQTMRQEKSKALFINTPEGNCAGVVTESDLARKVIAGGVDITGPVSEIMSSPVHGISEDALVFEALMSMMERNIRQLGVMNSADKVVGVVSDRDLLEAQGHSPLFLLKGIIHAPGIAEIIEERRRLPGLVRNLIASGAKARNVTRFITTVSDTIMERIMAITLDALGPPPVKFAFMILGSEGRKEQTLKTDQDNALIYEDVPESAVPEAKGYFLSFGEMACTLLDQAGYDFCTGNVMAKNPDWCQPISQWKQYFSDWILVAEAEDLLQASIFFDLRFGYGEERLVNELRTHLFNTLGGWSGFFRHLAENALHFKPPLGFFRNFVVESKGEHRNKFDIKSAMTPVVDFARIFALKYKLEETNTLDRLHQLSLQRVLTPKEYEELDKAYSFMLQLRFARQVTAVLDEKSAPDNYINPKELTTLEQKMLKEIFIRIAKFQGKLETDFIGII